MEGMKIPGDLIEKYNVPVPRYTSYPPANSFTTEYVSTDYIRSLEASNHASPENISVYIHIPFCNKLCHYCGCNTHFTRNQEKIKTYVNAVKKEIRMVKNHLDKHRRISQVHWGGGTPNSLPPEMIEELMAVVREDFLFTPKPEIAIECHPALLEGDYIEKLADAGFNRISLGIQDFNPAVLRAVNRDEPKIPVEELVDIIRSKGSIGVNFDFIYGLPFQDAGSFAASLERAAKIAPDRIVTFSYAHVPWIKKAQKILERKGLPSPAEKLNMFLTGYQILTLADYKPIGLDHFAKSADELNIALKNRNLHRNFQGYCTRETTGQVYAFGTTGISQTENAYMQNTRDLDNYIALISKGMFATDKGYILSPTDKIIRHVINEVMCNHYVSWEQAAQVFHTSVSEIKNTIRYNELSLAGFASDNLLSFNGSEVELTLLGRFFIRNIAACFDPHYLLTTSKFSKSL